MALVLVLSGLAAGQEKVALTVGHLEKSLVDLPISVPLDGFHAAHPKVALERLPWTDDLARAAALPLSDLPDLLVVQRGARGVDLHALVDKGYLVALDKAFKDAGLEPEDIDENVRIAVMYHGRVWALPFEASDCHLIYSKPIFKEAGLEPRFESWEEMLDAFEKLIARAEPGTRAGIMENRWSRLDPLKAFALAAGCAPQALIDFSALDSDAYVHAYRMMIAYEQSNVICAPEGWFDGEGRYRFDEEMRARFGDWEKRFPKLDSFAAIKAMAAAQSCGTRWLVSNDAYGLLPFPRRLERDSAAPPAAASSISATVVCFAVRRNTPEKMRAALAFIRWLLEPQTHVEALKIGDLRATVPEYGRIPHVPLIGPFLELPEFKQMMAECPDYALLVDHLQHAYYGYNRTEAATKLEERAEYNFVAGEVKYRGADGTKIPDAVIGHAKAAVGRAEDTLPPQSSHQENY